MSGKRLKKSKKRLQNRTLYCIITRKRFEMDLYLYSIIFCERYPLAYSKIFLQLNRQWQNDLHPRSSSVFFYFPFHFSWYKRKPLCMEMEPSACKNTSHFWTDNRKVIYHREHIHFRRWKERGETDFRKAPWRAV